MTDAEENLRNLCVLREVGGLPCPISDFGDAGEFAYMELACWVIPEVNFPRVLRVGSWNASSIE